MGRPFDWATLREDYERLGSAMAVAAEYGCDYSGVVKALKRKRIPIRPRYPYNWDNLERDVRRLGSVRAVARAYGCASSSADAQARKRGISIVPALEKTGGKDGRGRQAELLALKILPGAVDLNAVQLHSPYDLHYQGNRVDVKSSRLMCGDGNRGWRFGFNGKKNRVDAVLCLCLDAQGSRVLDCYLVPTSAIRAGSLRIPQSGAGRLAVYRRDVPKEVANADLSYE